MAFVVSGSLASKVGDEPERTYRAGEAWWEPPGAVHRVSRNASSSEPATLLAIYIAPMGATGHELMKPSESEGIAAAVSWCTRARTRNPTRSLPRFRRRRDMSQAELRFVDPQRSFSEHRSALRSRSGFAADGLRCPRAGAVPERARLRAPAFSRCWWQDRRIRRRARAQIAHHDARATAPPIPEQHLRPVLRRPARCVPP